MSKSKIVNVASVPQRSPFRYPGGKTWLVPLLRNWMRSLPERPAKFIEPFAGGGIISLTAAFESLADQVVMVELDEDVAAVWQTILGGQAQWLADQITNFQLTAESAKEKLAETDPSVREKAFRTILKNRVQHGGIMAHGASLIKHGENGKGIASRWYPATLRKRVLEIEAVKERITFIQGDGLKSLKDHADEERAVHFIDPPYNAAGKKAGLRLYKHNELNHAALFELADAARGDFLMTYDNAEGVRQLAQRHGFDTELVAMKNTHHAKMTELLIGRNLSWVRQPPAYTQQELF